MKIGEPYPGPYEVATAEGIGYIRDNEGAVSIRARDVTDPDYTVPVARAVLTIEAKRGQKYNTHDPRQLGTAHLLASAWDLRVALQEAVSALQGSAHGSTGSGRDEIIAKGLAALAKARGDGFVLPTRESAQAAIREKLKS